MFAPGGFGTGDAFIFHDGVLYVFDFKYGKGYECCRAQLMLYALGAFYEYGFDYQIDMVKMIIVQPRLDHIETKEMRSRTCWRGATTSSALPLSWLFPTTRPLSSEDLPVL